MSTEMGDVSSGAMIVFLEEVAEVVTPSQIAKFNDILWLNDVEYQFGMGRNRKVEVWTR